MKYEILYEKIREQNVEDKIFGARASVYIQFAGNIESLVGKLSQGLLIPDFVVKTRESPPYDKMAEFEALGFEGWLEKSGDIQEFEFRLTMETGHCLREHYEGQMHDLSPWLARFITDICGLETCV